jgi:hypothetical protein
MAPLPPPAPTAQPTATPPPTSRRHLVVAAVAATALGIGGLAVGSQFAAADGDEPTDQPATADDTIVEQPIDDTPAEPTTSGVDPADDASVDDGPADDASVDDDGHPGPWDLPALDELGAAFEDFETCLSEQFPDLMDGGWLGQDADASPDAGDQKFDELLDGTVTVFSPGAEGGALEVLDFGEGDGTITITRRDGEITVSTEGDVESLDAAMPDLSDLDVSDLDLSDLRPDPAFDAALEECAAVLPGGGIFDMIGDIVGEFGHGAGDGG